MKQEYQAEFNYMSQTVHNEIQRQKEKRDQDAQHLNDQVEKENLFYYDEEMTDSENDNDDDDENRYDDNEIWEGEDFEETEEIR